LGGRRLHLLPAVDGRNTDDLAAAGRRHRRAAYTSTIRCGQTFPAFGAWRLQRARRSPTRSYNDYEIVADNLLNGTQRSVRDRINAYGLFVDPPLDVGMSDGKLQVEPPVGSADDARRAVERASRKAS
jgi:hypothetical protein